VGFPAHAFLRVYGVLSVTFDGLGHGRTGAGFCHAKTGQDRLCGRTYSGP